MSFAKRIKVISSFFEGYYTHKFVESSGWIIVYTNVPPAICEVYTGRVTYIIYNGTDKA